MMDMENKKEKKVLTFSEVGRINIAEGRDIVVSRVNETGNISIAQLLTRTILETGEKIQYFPKHSTTILNDNTLTEYINMLNSINQTKTNKKVKGIKNNG